MANTPRFTVEIYHDLVPYLAGISPKEFFLDADKLIAAWKVATEWTLDTFHGTLAPRVPTAAPNSYGHLVCLGAPLTYSETAEPNVGPAADSLEECIRILEDRRGMDFTAEPLFRQYAELSRRVKEAFPQAPVMAGLGMEGPLTSAALFRGQDFYCDVIDEPELTIRFLDLMTDSLIEFRRQLNVFSGGTAVSARPAGLPDDLASMISPSLWREMVIPFWKKYYAGVSSASGHHLHCEAVVPAHLPYIREAGVGCYQPSVSPALTLEDVRDHLGLPFDWLLYAYQITEMDDEQIEQWIARTVAFNPVEIRTQFGAYAASIGKTDRIQTFIDVGRRYSENI